jgi:hypothetical protein
MSVPNEASPRLYWAGLVLLVAGVGGFGIRVALTINHGTYDWGDVFLIVGSGGIAVVGLYTMRSSRT